MSVELLVDGFDRVRQVVRHAVHGLTEEQLAWRPEGTGNSVGWLVWHLTRVQDDHVAGVADLEQVWTAQDWVARFDLPFPPSDIGFGHSSSDVSSARFPSPALLTDYHDAVHARTTDYLRSLTEDELPEVVDENWDPPVTRAVRLVSALSDDLQHAGQAAFVRGLLPAG